MSLVTRVMSHIFGVRNKADSQKEVREAADFQHGFREAANLQKEVREAKSLGNPDLDHLLLVMGARSRTFQFGNVDTAVHKTKL